MDKNQVLQNIAQKERTAGILWIVVASIQLILGLIVNWIVLLVGIWNLIVGITRITSAGKIEERTNIVEEYEKSLTTTIIFIVINVIIGGLIGILGAVFDLITRSYVLSNRDIINGSSNSSNSNIKYEELEKLHKLRESGALTEEEYNAEKQKILR